MAAKRSRRTASQASRAEADSNRSGGADLSAREVHVSGDVVGRDKTELNIGRATIISLDRRVLAIAMGVLLLAGLAAVVLSRLGKTPWATWEPVDESRFGIAIAEFTVGGELKESPQGAEVSRLIYTKIEGDLKQAGLNNRVALTKVGPLRTAEEAADAGERVNADMVLWGWVPEYAQEAIVPNFTLVGEQATRTDASLIDSLNLIISGPGTIQLSQVSGRATALSRFVLGIIYLRDEPSIDYAEGLRMFTLGIQELEQDLARFAELAQGADVETRLALDDAQLATRKSLAAFYTLQGVAYAALGRPVDALTSYETARTYDDAYPRLHVALGNYYYDLRRFAEAKAAYQRALDLGVNTASAYYGLGVVNYELHDYSSALAALDSAIQLAQANQDDATVAVAHLVAGHAYLAQGQTAEALQEFRIVVESPAASETLKQAAQAKIASIENPAPTPSIAATPSPASPAASPTGTPTPTPTFTPSMTRLPRAARFELTAPAWGTTHRNPITFEWTGPLGSGQVYQVTAYHPESDDSRQSELLSTSSWTVELPRYRDGEWRWRVSILSGSRVVTASAESFFWFNPLLGTGSSKATSTLFSTPFPTDSAPTLFPTLFPTPPPRKGTPTPTP